MLVKILGSAAGGAFPQWNCGCANCSSLRAGTFRGKARSQTQVAVSEDGVDWFLLGASPDLRGQIEATPVLHPRDGMRSSPIRGVILTNADLDHVLGLLLLRELQPLDVYSTASVMRVLRNGNSMFGMLNRVPNQVSWKTIVPGSSFELMAGKVASGLRCEAISLSSRYPLYVDDGAGLMPDEAVVGLFVKSTSGKALAFLPAVAQFNDALIERLKSVDAALVDGTFWSDEELKRVEGGSKTAREMGHSPIGSPGGTLERLGAVTGIRKIFLHINNTNPMLDERSSEHRSAREAGWEIAEDGWELEV